MPGHILTLLFTVRRQALSSELHIYADIPVFAVLVHLIAMHMGLMKEISRALLVTDVLRVARLMTMVGKFRHERC